MIINEFSEIFNQSKSDAESYNKQNVQNFFIHFHSFIRPKFITHGYAVSQENCFLRGPCIIPCKLSYIKYNPILVTLINE